MRRLFGCCAAVAVFLAGATTDSLARVIVRPAVAQQPVTIFSFPTLATGINPVGGLVDVGGSLYGTTSGGGSCATNSYGCGTIYAVGKTTAPGHQVRRRIVSIFAGSPTDGAAPQAGLIAISNALYGTTQGGGAAGTVFVCGLTGGEHPIFIFSAPDGVDGGQPVTALFASGSELYGTTHGNGAFDEGVVFKMNIDGSNYAVLHNFGGTDGAYPTGGLLGLTTDGSFNLYGTTSEGGTAGGTVFQLNATGTTVWSYPFEGPPTDGVIPEGTLIALNGFLYGTTASGGTYNAGTVFRIPKTGGKPTILHSFVAGSDGATPFAGLLYDKSNGYLYGTTAGGNAVLYGTVFKMLPSGANFSVLHYFFGPTPQDETDGNSPRGNLILADGLLYGTTIYGGTAGLGTVFAVKP